MQLPPCDKNIYENGTTVFLTNTISSEKMEKWVKMIAQESEQPVDWRMGCGRAEVLTTGDIQKVHNAIIKNKKIHDQYYMEECTKYISQKMSEKSLDNIWNEFYLKY